VKRLLILLGSLSVPATLLAQGTTEPSGTATGAAAALLGTCLIVGLVILVINILLLIWVYKDAKARGQNAVLWLILTFFFGIVALIVWLIIRPKEKVGEGPKPPEPPKPA
jgi:RsiW-degrading membrane proteinase PrsW (M82 family)